MPAYSFSVDSSMPYSHELKVATLIAASLSGAKVIGASSMDGTVLMEFDSNISQKLIVDVLEIILEIWR